MTHRSGPPISSLTVGASVVAAASNGSPSSRPSTTPLRGFALESGLETSAFRNRMSYLITVRRTRRRSITVPPYQPGVGGRDPATVYLTQLELLTAGRCELYSHHEPSSGFGAVSALPAASVDGGQRAWTTTHPQIYISGIPIRRAVGKHVSIVYFAHSYRDRDASVVDFFARLIRSEGLTLSLDPPSDSVNAAKLQRHLNASDGLIAVLSKRPEGTSPHILFEINLAIKTGTPLMVFVEDTISSQVLSARIPQQRFSLRWYLREVREHRHVLKAFKGYLHEYSPPRFRPATAKRSCVVVGLQNVAPEVAGEIHRWVEADADYELAPLPSDARPYESYELLRNANVAIALQTGSPAYADGLLAGIGIPTIALSWAHPTVEPNWPPREYLPRRATDDLALSILRQEFDLYEEDFLDLPNQEAVDRYASLLVDLHGVYDDLSRDYVQEVVMGDKYVASGQTGAVGPNAHVHNVSFQQAWMQFSDATGESDLGTLAEELEELRQHLRSQSTTRDQDAELVEIGAAASAAEGGDGPKALGHLAKVGKWALGAATAIGTAVAAAAIRAATGMP